MNRALPLLLLMAAIAGGLCIAALRSSRAAVESSDPAPARGPESGAPAAEPAPVDLAPVDPSGPTSSFESAEKWDIIPMNRVGQVLSDAQITATHAGEKRTASGRTKWTDAEAGDWDLEIKSEGSPTWRRVVTLEAGERRRTVAYLSDEIRIDGTVVDTFGEPVANTAVFLLPRGTLHPTRHVAPQAGSHPAAQVRTKSDPLGAQTSATGQFRIVVPAAGSWRLSVGRAGDARWTQPETSDLSHGGPDKVTATVPAAARLVVEFLGSAEDRPKIVRAYRFDADMARMTAAKAANESEAQYGSEKATEGASVLGKDLSDTADGGTNDSSKRRSEPRLFEPGWVMLASEPVSADGRAELVDMPGGEDLRFLFIRNRDRMVTSGAYRLAAGKRSLARASLPPAGSIPAGMIDRRSSLSIGPDDLGDVEDPEPGVHWAY